MESFTKLTLPTPQHAFNQHICLLIWFWGTHYQSKFTQTDQFCWIWDTLVTFDRQYPQLSSYFRWKIPFLSSTAQPSLRSAHRPNLRGVSAVNPWSAVVQPSTTVAPQLCLLIYSTLKTTTFFVKKIVCIYIIIVQLFNLPIMTVSEIGVALQLSYRLVAQPCMS